jgi:hypothetical protein
VPITPSHIKIPGILLGMLCPASAAEGQAMSSNAINEIAVTLLNAAYAVCSTQ